MSKRFCCYLCIFIMIVYSSKHSIAKKVASKSRLNAAPAWNPSSEEEEEEAPVLTRRFLTPATLPPLPLPPIDPDIDLDDRSVLVAANERAEENQEEEEEENVPATTETTNLRIRPFSRKHQTILPIPPSISEQIDDASGEEELKTAVIIPSAIEQSESPENSEPSAEILVPAASDELPPSRTILIPAESDNRNIEFIPMDGDEKPVNVGTGKPPSIRPPPKKAKTIVRIRRPNPHELVPPSPPPRIQRPNRLIAAPSSEIPVEELESDELVPVVEPTPVPIPISENRPQYSIIPTTVEKPKSVEKADYSIEKEPDIVLPPPKKKRKMYKVYRPDVIEVNEGTYQHEKRPVYIAKRPPILVEEIEIPEKLIESLQGYSTAAPIIFNKKRKGSGQFPPKRHSYRRAYRRPQTTTTQLPPTTTTSAPSTKHYKTSIKRLLFTYKSRFVTTTTEMPSYTSRTTQAPLEFVYKKVPLKSSYRRFVVQQKSNEKVYRRRNKTYPKHQKYLRSKKTRLYPKGYQNQLVKHAFYGYS